MDKEKELYKKMYLHMFNKVETAIKELEKGLIFSAADILKKAQEECEDIYISGE